MKIGDPVEVKFAKYNPKRGRSVVDFWRPATVVAVWDDAVTVAFADHSRMEVERGRNKFRKVRS